MSNIKWANPRWLPFSIRISKKSHKTWTSWVILMFLVSKCRLFRAVINLKTTINLYANYLQVKSKKKTLFVWKTVYHRLVHVFHLKINPWIISSPEHYWTIYLAYNKTKCHKPNLETYVNINCNQLQLELIKQSQSHSVLMYSINYETTLT